MFVVVDGFFVTVGWQSRKKERFSLSSNIFLSFRSERERERVRERERERERDLCERE